MSTEQTESDILGDLAYAAAHIDVLDKEQIVTVLQAAIAEIIELRMQAAAARSLAHD